MVEMSFTILNPKIENKSDNEAQVTLGSSNDRSKKFNPIENPKIFQFPPSSSSSPIDLSFLSSKNNNNNNDNNDNNKGNDSDSVQIARESETELGAENFLESLNLPDTRERASTQLNQARDRLANKEMILKVLEQSCEIAKKSLMPSPERQQLLNELELNIHRHKVLVKREKLKILIREDDLKKYDQE